MAKGNDPSETIQDFKSCVNMDARELEEWLKTDDSNRVPPTTYTRVLTRHIALKEQHDSLYSHGL